MDLPIVKRLLEIDVCDDGDLWESASLHAKAARIIEALAEALEEAIALRVKLYRNGDAEGEEDHLPDAEIARRETYARKWSAALALAKGEK